MSEADRIFNDACGRLGAALFTGATGAHFLGVIEGVAIAGLWLFSITVVMARG